MEEYILENKNIISKDLCYDIINLFNINCGNNEYYDIPKNIIKNENNNTNNEWSNIERFIYKQILINIYKYKQKIILSKPYFIKSNGKNEDFRSYLLQNLNKNMQIKYFTIQKLLNNIDFSSSNKTLNYNMKIKCNNSRYNILSFIFFLNKIVDGGEIHFNDNIIVKSEIGKLVIFPEDINFIYNYICPKKKEDIQYIITGQILIY